ncbi:YopX family protein [Bacillus stercoris]
MYYWDDEELSLEIKMDEWVLSRNDPDGCRVAIAKSFDGKSVLMCGTGFFEYGVIYQADIIKGKRESTWHPGYDKVLGKVEFSKDTHGFYIEGMGAGPLYRIEPNFEILGDVYQNPKSLEGAE